MADRLTIRNLGQITKADLTFGDLTVFVGPQASGKSIALQLLKLVVDAGQIQAELKRYGLDWSKRVEQFLGIYFGEGMERIWRPGETSVRWQGAAFDAEGIVARARKNKDESLFFIPAQRVLALREGWPRPFSDFSAGDPFAVREFSEKLRQLMERGWGGESVFPQERRLKAEFRKLIQDHFFGGFELKVDSTRRQKRLVLEGAGGEEPLPYMVWSAGQREFVPLLLGLYWLMPRTAAPRQGALKWVVLEELEMGLHPRAITVVLLLVFELLRRGYKVCLSTHSTQVLDALWALKHLRENGAGPEAFLGVFDAPGGNSMEALARSALAKAVNVYYFERKSGEVRDISTLDVEADTAWGGLSEFSSRANEEVARAVANRSAAD